MPKIGIFVHFGPAHLVPVGGFVGGCGARAVSRKTPIYFIRSTLNRKKTAKKKEIKVTKRILLDSDGV